MEWNKTEKWKTTPNQFYSFYFCKFFGVPGENIPLGYIICDESGSNIAGKYLKIRNFLLIFNFISMKVYDTECRWKSSTFFIPKLKLGRCSLFIQRTEKDNFDIYCLSLSYFMINLLFSISKLKAEKFFVLLQFTDANQLKWLAVGISLIHVERND